MSDFKYNGVSWKFMEPMENVTLAQKGEKNSTLHNKGAADDHRHRLCVCDWLVSQKQAHKSVLKMLLNSHLVFHIIK